MVQLLVDDLRYLLFSIGRGEGSGFSKICIAELSYSHRHKAVAARNHHLAHEALSHMRATEKEAELHRRLRALAEVNTLFGTTSC